MRHARLIAAVLAASLPRVAQAGSLCTLVMDAASGRVLLERGDCRRRVTPASTFKVPLAVMGFDSGFLTEAHAPVLTYKAGDPDWGGEAWRQPTNPTRWLIPTAAECDSACCATAWLLIRLTDEESSPWLGSQSPARI